MKKHILKFSGGSGLGRVSYFQVRAGPGRHKIFIFKYGLGRAGIKLVFQVRAGSGFKNMDFCRPLIQIIVQTRYFQLD